MFDVTPQTLRAADADLRDVRTQAAAATAATTAAANKRIGE
jgi:hypothetical protein